MGKGYHPSGLTVKARNKIIMAQETVLPTERSEVMCARTLIKNGQDWNRPDLTQRGIAMLIRLAYPVSLGTLDAQLIVKRRDWFLREVNGWSNGSE